MDRNELRRQAKEHIEVKLALEGEPPLVAHLEAVADKKRRADMPDGDTDMTGPVQAEVETESMRRGADELLRINRQLEDLAATKTEFHDHVFNKIAVPQTILGRYSYAAAVFAVAFALRWLFVPNDAGAFILFYPAVVIATFLCGTGAGLLVTALSLLAGNYFFIAPYESFVITREKFSVLAIFATFGVLISLMIGKMLRGAGAATLLNRQLNETLGPQMLQA